MKVLIAALSLLVAISVSPAAVAGNAKPKPAASGQMICSGPQGCRPVRPGCHIESSNYVGQVEVCGNSKRPE